MGFNPIKMVLLGLIALLTGCMATTTAKYQNSSVVDYLYPDAAHQKINSEVPVLALPLKVGIAFTPDSHRRADSLTEPRKRELMERISKQFESIDFVKRIEIIPSGYLRPQGSFDNLDQLKRMFDIDLIALVSYDQTRFTDEGMASLAYWTIVGAYIVPAEKNATHTLMDAVVYDINSHKMLFRAPGTSTVKSNATLVNLSEQTRKDSDEGFTVASDDLVKNLKLQLSAFKERVKESPADYQVIKREGYQGGALDWWILLIMGLAVSVRLRKDFGNT